MAIVAHHQGSPADGIPDISLGAPLANAGFVPKPDFDGAPMAVFGRG
jgi:hypothetical protein